MPRVTLPYTEWLPDQPLLNLAGQSVADGVYPVANGYKPMGQFVASPNGTLAADCLGAVSALSNAGATYTVAGTATNLYRYTTSGWSSLASGFSATAAAGWRFEQWGNWLLCTNGTDAIRKIDMGAGSIASLGGSPPTAEFIAVVRDFVVLGRPGGAAQTVRWSAINDAESWTIGTNQADDQVMPTGGQINGITGGEYGLVLQERRVSRMTYVGTPAIFQFDELNNEIGCIARKSVARVGQMTFFLSTRGFAMCDGSSVRVLGEEKVNRRLRSEISPANYNAMSVTIDPRNSLVVWAIPNATPSTRLYIYNWSLDRFTTTTQDVQQLFVGLSEGLTLEGLSALYSNLDTLAISLDDDQWKGGAPNLMLVNSGRQLGTMSGSPRLATFTTGDMGLAGGRRARLRFVRVLADTEDGLTVKIAGAPRRGEALQEATFTGNNRIGDVAVRANWQYPRITVTIAAGTEWSEATGLEVQFEDGGA